ncbi:MAG TPA: LysR family transcriptional regulator [Acidobacteriaceae bacterium]|nr:LysR family transcriptional regulator [Acidobacteriaceae bacterium]
MLRNETKLMESVIALAEELHFQRAARKLRISQPMLTKNIQDIETIIGGPLFVRNRKQVVLNDAGRAYVQHARLSLHYGERAIQAARAVMQDLDVPFYIGRSPYTDPFLTSTLLSIHLPLYPKLRIELESHYSLDLVHDLLDGTLDLAIANEPPETALLTQIQIADAPFYIAMARRDPLAAKPAVSLADLTGRRWILFERRLHPPVYDSILEAAEHSNARPNSIQHITTPEEAFPFVADTSAVAFLVKAGALLMARNGVTVRPLVEAELRLHTYLVSRADNDSKLASEIVRTFVSKISEVGAYRQLSLPISA